MGTKKEEKKKKKGKYQQRPPTKYTRKKNHPQGKEKKEIEGNKCINK